MEVAAHEYPLLLFQPSESSLQSTVKPATTTKFPYHLSLSPTNLSSFRAIHQTLLRIANYSRETSTFSSNLTTMQLATQHEIDMACIVFMMTGVSIISILGSNILNSGNVYGRT